MTLTRSDEKLLHVWLIAAESSPRLLSGVCAMLRELAERSGGGLGDPMDVSGSSLQADHYLVPVLGAAAMQRLSQECGIHRGQVVPESSETGRVETELVGVELIADTGSASGSRPHGPVLRTYNYVSGVVFDHRTGKRLALEAALRGEE